MGRRFFFASGCDQFEMRLEYILLVTENMYWDCRIWSFGSHGVISNPLEIIMGSIDMEGCANYGFRPAHAIADTEKIKLGTHMDCWL